MLLSAHDIPHSTVLDCDLCIIGTGAAGITLGREFVHSRTQVILARLLPAQAVAAVIGRAYLTSSPDDGNLATLVRQLLAMADGTGDLQAAIGSRVRKDFDEHQTVRVRGWVLSRTEARLCALSALLMDGHRSPASWMA